MALNRSALRLQDFACRVEHLSGTAQGSATFIKYNLGDGLIESSFANLDTEDHDSPTNLELRTFHSWMWNFRGWGLVGAQNLSVVDWIKYLHLKPWVKQSN